MAYHRLALSALLVASASISNTQAFSPAGLPATRAVNANSLRMVATTPADLGININVNEEKSGEERGAMMDLTGIVFSVSWACQCKAVLIVCYVCRVKRFCIHNNDTFIQHRTKRFFSHVFYFDSYALHCVY